MADNTQLNVGSGGDVIASDDIGGVKFQRVKVTIGADGVNDGDLSSSNPLPVSDVRLQAAAALADGAANPTTTTVGAANLVYNGTTWDRLESASAFDTGANNNFSGALAVKNVPYKTSVSLGSASNSISTFNVNGCSNVSLALSGTTTGTFVIEGTGDLANWSAVECFDIFSDVWVSGQSITPTNGKLYSILAGGLRQIRVRVTSTLGTNQSLYWNGDNSQEFIAGIDTGAAPHNFGYVIFHKEGNYAATQTSTTLHATTTGKRFAITDITVSTDGTTAGVVTIYDATTGTAFSAGTTPSIFRSSFAPSTTVKPGAIKQFPIPYLSAAVSNSVLVTITGITASYIQINGYEI